MIFNIGLSATYIVDLLHLTLMSSPTISAWQGYGIWGINLATAATSYGFQMAKTGTKLAVSGPLCFIERAN